MRIQYGLAEWDRMTGVVSWHIKLPMDDVGEGMLPEFLQDAGDKGWELCGAFPVGVKGNKRPSDASSTLLECKDPAEQIAMIFKRTDPSRSGASFAIGNPPPSSRIRGF